MRIGHLYPKVKLPGSAGFQPAKEEDAGKMPALPEKGHKEGLG
jgi:hypothetical protein